MEQNVIEKYINDTITTGCDFSDIFYEKTISKNYIFNDSKLDKITTSIKNGVGIRIVFGENVFYSSTNDLSEDNITKIIKELREKEKGKIKFKNIKLNNKIVKKLNIKNNNQEYPNELKVEYLKKIDGIARNYDERINQVQISLYEYDQNINIGNTLGKYVDTDRSLTRIYVTIYSKDGNKKASSSFSYGESNGYNFIDNFDIEAKIIETCKSSIEKLYAKPSPGGKMPVIVGSGFGVMIHEAVGHSLEATTVAKGISILSNKIGKKVASDIVTVVDDGTIENSWGSYLIDDEGNLPQKNICIENGILKGYLTDEVNSKKMKMDVTGSGRRQDYMYIPTSRMTNTNLMSGNSTIEEMIESIDFGLYAKVMGGGSVDPVTGDFNFGVNEAYIIKNGKIGEMVKGASLLGNTPEVMENIEMISSDFAAEAGICGSASGNVPVTCGQPTIKISSILVGGGSND